MPSSTASAVSHYSVAIFGAYKRQAKRINARRKALEAEIIAVPVTKAPVTAKAAAKTIQEAVPSIDMAIVNAAISDIKAENQQTKVMMEDVKQRLLRMQQDLDDEEALAALL